MTIIDEEMKDMALKVQNLNKKFKGKQALQDVSLELERGQVLAVIGNSGAGKTTLLRCINGLEECDGGSIEISGMQLCKDGEYASSSEIRKIRKEVGMVFQNFNLFPHMTVLENIIEAPVSAYKASKKDAEERALKLLEMVNLEEKKSAYPCQLSGGQKQRVAIARACALNPSIMCFDEPTSALDPELTESIATMMEIFAKENMAVLVITHDMAFARRVASRIIFMQDGQILADEDKDKLLSESGNEKARKFILG